MRDRKMKAISENARSENESNHTIHEGEPEAKIVFDRPVAVICN